MNGVREEKLFGKYHDLLLLLIGFVLTSLLGGYLTHAWQTRAADITRLEQQKQSEIQSARAVFEETSRLMDKRIYRMRRISMGYGNSVDSDELEVRWGAYREVLFEWNENLNRNLALVQMYFGENAREILEKDIQQRFIRFGRMIEQSRKNPQSNSYEQRLKVADDLNNYIYNFDLHLIEKIQNGNVGAFK